MLPEKFTLPLSFETVVKAILDHRSGGRHGLVIELDQDPRAWESADHPKGKPVSAWSYRNGELIRLPSVPDPQRPRPMPWLEAAVTGPNTFYFGQMVGHMVGWGYTVTVDENGKPNPTRVWVS
jgi:hypothetical protein